MKLLTSHLVGTKRSAVRFTIVGTVGTILQYAIYHGFLCLFEACYPGKELTTLAFVLGFLLEMVYNYILTSYYTFEQKPDVKNLLFFLGGRGVNFAVQMVLLRLLLRCVVSKSLAGAGAILLAGVVNYLVLKPLFERNRR